MSLFKASLPIALFIVVCGAAAAPQEPNFNAQSNVVLVPTLVRDANGNVVYGLQATDFVIEDDGVEQKSYLDEAAEAEHRNERRADVHHEIDVVDVADCGGQ